MRISAGIRGLGERETRKFAEYFKDLVITCLYGQKFKKKAQLKNLGTFPAQALK